MREPDNGLKGRWFGRLSMRPALDAFDFVLRTESYVRDRRAAANELVFAAHPGVRSTMVTDMAGMEFVFHAPPDLLDRVQDGSPGFGCLGLNHRALLGGAVPALVAGGALHEPARALVVEAMKLRAPFFSRAAERVYDYGWPGLRPLSRGQEAPLLPVLHDVVVGIVFEWLFGLSEHPGGAETESWLKACFRMRSDRPVANWAAGLLSRAQSGPRKVHRDFSQQVLEQIRGSQPYPAFVEIARRVGVPEEETAAHLMFAALFNATGGACTTVYPAMAILAVDRVIRDRVFEELKPFRGRVEGLGELRYLEDFMLETMRLFGRPRQYYRRALVDLELPVSVGPPVPVRAGTTLVVVANVARQDPMVWDDDAHVFDPDRFARRPALRDRVYPFGPPSGAKNRFGCAGGANGTAALLWKTVVAAMARDRSWTLRPWPEPDPDVFSGVVQKGVKVVRV
jgi:Cytochrome P450